MRQTDTPDRRGDKIRTLGRGEGTKGRREKVRGGEGGHGRKGTHLGEGMAGEEREGEGGHRGGREQTH